LADGAPLTDIPWLPSQLAAQLSKYDIRTASELLGVVSDARMTAQVITMLKVRRADLGRWADQTRMLELPGASIEIVNALGRVGVSSIAALAHLGDEELDRIRMALRNSFTVDVLRLLRDSALRVVNFGPCA
jgi:hypothetical protein